MRLDFSGLAVLPTHTFETISSFERGDLSVRKQSNGWSLLNSPDQITRHAVGQSARTDQQVHVLCGLRQKHGGLPSRVASADNNHLFSGAQLRLHERCPIIDAVTFELRQVLE